MGWSASPHLEDSPWLHPHTSVLAPPYSPPRALRPPKMPPCSSIFLPSSRDSSGSRSKPVPRLRPSVPHSRSVAPSARRRPGKRRSPGQRPSGQTSIGVNSASNIQKGTTLAILSASTKIGEIVAISSISGTTLTASTNLINSYSTSDLVFLVEDTASGGTIIPSNSGAWSASSSYSATLYPPIGVFVLHALNGDGTQTVNITAFNDEVPTLQ